MGFLMPMTLKLILAEYRCDGLCVALLRVREHSSLSCPSRMSQKILWTSALPDWGIKPLQMGQCPCWVPTVAMEVSTAYFCVINLLIRSHWHSQTMSGVLAPAAAYQMWLGG
jgi:hypothetical protein